MLQSYVLGSYSARRLGLETTGGFARLEVVDDGETGLLVDATSPEAIADAIRAAAERASELATEYGNNRGS